MPECRFIGRQPVDEKRPPLNLTRSERRFRSSVTSISQVRSFVREFASQWPFPETRLSDIALAASELATNAVVHGSGESFELRLQGSVTGFALEVVSHGALTMPEIRSRSPFEQTGRGLLIVSQVSDSLSALGSPLAVTMSCQFDVERRGQKEWPLPIGAIPHATTGKTQ